MKLSPRFTIAGLMVVVLVTSLGLAALSSGSKLCAGGVYLLTNAVFTLAVVGVVCRKASERAWWLGFALFGFNYRRWATYHPYQTVKLPTTALLEAMYSNLYRNQSATSFYDPSHSYQVIGDCLWSLLIAMLGGLLAHALFGGPAIPQVERAAESLQTKRPAWGMWVRVASGGLAALLVGTVMVLIALESNPTLWVGAVYLLTWVVLGIMVLGFACGHGRRRMIWFGAALFGIGYMVLNHKPDRYEESSYGHLVADDILAALRPWLPPLANSFPGETAAMRTENARIVKALEQPVAMTYGSPTSLEDLLNHIQEATRTPDGHEIWIYVDPIGLEEAEKSLQSPIKIDLLGVPLSTTLPLALRQLGLVYYVKDGLLFITSESASDIPGEVDNYLLLGHCVLSWLAAGLGAWLVPLVSHRGVA